MFPYIKRFKIDSRASESIDKKKAGYIRLYVLSAHFKMIKTGNKNITINTINKVIGACLLYSYLLPPLAVEYFHHFGFLIIEFERRSGVCVRRAIYWNGGIERVIVYIQLAAAIN